uniref:Uncharacterized protein n=1 Tax=Photinus pyralis TaxID=7054 RepID=A0A1Y1ML18_PHOPY
MVSKGTKQEKSPQRSPVKSYRKSPSRAVKSKSPSRLTTNSPPASPRPRRSIRQSPSRTTTSTPKKSPSRRSPARTTPSRIDTNKSNVPDRITRASSKSRQEIESETDDELPLAVRASPKTRGRPKKINTEVKESQVVLQNIIPKLREATPEIGSYINLMRRSATKSFRHEIDHIDHLKRESSTSSIRKLTELSDEDDIQTGDFREKSVRKSEPKLIDKITPNEFGLFNAFLFVLCLPLIPLIFLVYCNEKQCNFTASPKFNYSRISTYFGLKSFAISLCYILLVFVIGALPFGGPKVSGLPNRGSKLNYVMNGFFTLVLVGIVLILLETFTGVLVIENVLQNFFQHYVTLTVLGVILSVALYIRSFYVPLCNLKSDVLINNAIYNFYHGRDINPRVFGVVDFKLFLFRFFCISTIIMNAVLFYKSVSFKVLTDGDIDYKSIKYNETLAVFAAMQIIHHTWCIVYESSFVTTFTAQYEAVGYECIVSLLLGPIVEIGSSKYILDYGVTLPRWQLIFAGVLFMIGSVFYHGSNTQKHQFRLNPYHPKVSHLESLPSSQGRKLLVSGYWGMVRHPNYLGDIIIQMSFGLLVYNAVPVLVFIFDILWIINRISRTELKCEQRYGSAWKRYCQRVKYSLVPKVY